MPPNGDKASNVSIISKKIPGKLKISAPGIFRKALCVMTQKVFLCQEYYIVLGGKVFGGKYYFLCYEVLNKKAEY